MASGPLTVQLRINADGSAAIVGLRNVQGALDNTGQTARRTDTAMASLAGSLKGLALTAGAALSVQALASSFMAANIEASKLRAQLVTATGSVEGATKAWGALQAFAANSPFTLAEATQAFVTLKNRGLDASIGAMTSYGNTSAALGKSVTQMADAVADAVNGDFTRAEEAFSVNAKQNGDKVIMTFNGVSTEINNTSQDIQKYLQQIGNVDFAGGMERQGKTLAGVMSTLGDNWAQLMVTLGDTGATSLIGSAITEVSDKLNDLSESIQQGLPVGELGAQLAELEGATGGWGDAIAGIVPAWQGIFAELANMPNYVVAIRDGALAIEEQGTAWDAVKELVVAFGQAMIDLPDNLEKAVYIILGEIDILTVNFQSGMDSLPLYAQSAWAYIQNIILTAWVNIKIAVAEAVAWIAGRLASMATDMAGFFAKVPEAWDIGGMAAASAAQMTGLAASLNSTKDAVAGLKIEKAALGEAYTASAGKITGEIAAIQANGAAQTSAIRDNIQAGIADVDAKNQRRQAQVALNQEFAVAVKAEADLNKGAALTMGTEEVAAKIKAQLAEQVRKLYAEHGAGVKQHQALTAAQKILSDAEKAGIDVSKEKSAILKALKEDEAKATGAKQAGAKASREAAKAAKEYEKDLDALIKQFLPARDDAEKLAEATDLIAEAHAKGDLVGKDYTEMVKKVAEAYDTATNDAQKLIDKYDTEGAKARELAEDRAKLAAVLADGTLKVEGASKAMDKLTEAEKKNNSEADAWTEVWKNAVKRIDDTFANLWEDLFSGGKSTLDSLKRAITSWLAEVAHALLTKPLVVAITAGMTGGVGTASAATSAVGNAVGGVGSGFSSITNFASLASSIYSLGSTFISGVSAGFASMFSGTAGTALSFAGAGLTSGTMTGFVQGLGVAMPYLLPVIAVAAVGLSKYFSDQKPRYGAYAATTHGGVGQFEDNVGVRGAFGLTFGMNDKGSANIDANESRAIFEGFAKVSEAMAQFYGAEVSAQVEATLKKISQENYAKTGILNYAMDVNQAFDVAFTQIIDAAAATGDAVAVVMKAVVGDLSGTAETMAGQIEAAMNTTAAVIQVAKALEGTDSGKILELGTDLTANALRLVDYANAIKWTGETTAAALTRMGQYMTALNTALDLSGQTVDVTGQDFVDLARNLAYAADVAKIGIEGLMQLQAFYYEQFTSAEEKFTRNIKAAGKAISDGLKDLYDPELIKDREAFTDLLNGLDLTTESGRKLYVELLKLAPAFDAVFDGVESFMNWLRPQEQADRQRAQLEKLFQDWGMNLPDTKADLDALVASGALTAEQMAILGGYLDALSATFGELTDTVEDTTVRLEDIIREQQDLRSRLYATMGDDAMVTKLRRDEELAAALSDDNRDILRQIYLLEDLAKEEAERIEAAKTAATAAHEAAMAALTAQRDAAAATLNILQSTLSIIQSALDGLRVGRALYAEQRDAAARQLAAWASSGRLPEAEPLQRVLATLGRSGEQDYATGNAFRAAQGATFANLLKLEAVGTIQVDWAKATVESLERQMTFAQEAHTEMMSAFDAQIVKLSSLELLTDAQRAALEELLARIEGYLVPEKGPAPLDGLAFSPTTGLVEMGSSRNAQEQELQAIKEELILLRQDMAAASTAQVIPIKDMATRLQKWDLDGLPESSASSGTALRVA